MYWHESEERKPNKHPMCTTFPTQSPMQHNMNCYLEKRNLDWKLARENGWYESDDCGDKYVMYRRVVIPAVTHKAGHVYWQARDLFGHSHIRYQSPKGPRHEALVQVTPESSRLGVVVVEGPMDALAAAGAGYVSFALMGMIPSQATLYHLILLVHEYKELPILVLLDRGENANAMRISTFLSSQGYLAKFAELPEKDLAACNPLQRKSFLKQKFQSLFPQRNLVQHRKNAKRA